MRELSRSTRSGLAASLDDPGITSVVANVIRYILITRAQSTRRITFL